MPGLRSTVRVLRNDFPGLGAGTRRRVAAALDASAERVRLAARANTPPRVATGAMMEGYRVERVGALERAVYNETEYHAYHELGTSSIAPHPMLFPAAAEEAPRRAAELAKALKDEWR